MGGTRVLAADAPGAIAEAAEVLRRGGLVAFPTETVYGLGADATSADAVRRIFAAKGRPASNPVIVHVADAASAEPLVRVFTDEARALAGAFWPGPLTLVFPRSALTPDVVSGGGPTVAIRAPAHPVAQALLREAGVPIAAPSANRSTCVSPTRAAHVLRGLDGRVDLVLDGGPALGGLESTVFDPATRTLLRPGLVSVADLERVVGPIARRPQASSDIPLSPGQMARHYAPRTPLDIALDDGPARVRAALASGERVAWLTLGPPPPPAPNLVAVALPADVAAYASGLYAALHDLDDAGCARLIVDAPPETDAWLAVHDRLARARHAPS